jgi:hypothetical protein
MLVLASCMFLVACGGSMSPSPVVNGVPMSLTIGDTPPNGVAVLFFEALITRASLQPSVSVKGLLFDTPGTPTLVTRTMREHDDH